jgi:hypothetical protein
LNQTSPNLTNYNPNFELDKINKSLRDELEKLKTEAEIIVQERNEAGRKLDSLKSQMLVLEKEEEVHLEKLKKAMNSTQSSEFKNINKGT